MHVCMDACVHVSTCMHVCVCIHVCMYACVCMYAWERVLFIGTPSVTLALGAFTCTHACAHAHSTGFMREVQKQRGIRRAFRGKAGSNTVQPEGPKLKFSTPSGPCQHHTTPVLQRCRCSGAATRASVLRPLIHGQSPRHLQDPNTRVTRAHVAGSGMRAAGASGEAQYPDESHLAA